MKHKKLLQKDSGFISVTAIIQLIQLNGFVVVVTLLFFIQCFEKALYLMRHVYVYILGYSLCGYLRRSELSLSHIESSSI